MLSKKEFFKPCPPTRAINSGLSTHWPLAVKGLANALAWFSIHGTKKRRKGGERVTINKHTDDALIGQRGTRDQKGGGVVGPILFCETFLKTFLNDKRRKKCRFDKGLTNFIRNRFFVAFV